MKVWLVTVETFEVATLEVRKEVLSRSNEIFATEELAKQFSEEVDEIDGTYATTAEYSEVPVYTKLPL